MITEKNEGRITTSKTLGQQKSIRNIVFLLPLVMLTLSVTMADNAYGTIYGYYATQPAPGFGWTNLTYVQGNIYTYGGNIVAGSGPFHHINRMVWMNDVNGYSVGTGYYDATDGSGNEYYKYMYYVDDSPTNDNLTFIATGIPAIGSTHTAQVAPNGGSHNFAFYRDTSLLGTYACQYECSHPIKVAGASAWGDLDQTKMNTQTDISGLQLKVDTSSSWYTWTAAQGELKCGTTFPHVGFSSNDVKVNLSLNTCSTSTPVWLYNDAAGG